MAGALKQCKNHPLMILIDELDRCRPSYAIALIEVAKHLFDADHIVFVLAVNRTQLAHSIRALYGDRFDAPGYLRRFFDIDFTLPDPNRNRFIRDLLGRISRKDDIVLLNKFFGAADLSLRQVSQAIHRLGLATVANLNDIGVVVTSVALIVRTIDAELYRGFVRGDLSDQELVDGMYNRIRIKEPQFEADTQFEAVIVMAAKEIASHRNNLVYDRGIESSLIDRYKKEAVTQQKHGEQVAALVRDYEQSFGGRSLGFLEAVKRIELLR